MNWGVPEWRDASAYPEPDDLTARQWRWEFLRRRADYRSLWEKYFSQWEAHVHENKAIYELMIADTGQDFSTFMRSCPTDDPDKLRVEFGLSRLLDPARSLSSWELAQSAYSIHGSSPEWIDREQGEKWGEQGIHAVLFDVNAPLGPQLDHVKGMLERWQAEIYGKNLVSKPRRGNFPAYLRALDAAEDGASLMEMARYIHGEGSSPQKARDTLRAAKEQQASAAPL